MSSDPCSQPHLVGQGVVVVVIVVLRFMMIKMMMMIQKNMKIGCINLHDMKLQFYN